MKFVADFNMGKEHQLNVHPSFAVAQLLQSIGFSTPSAVIVTAAACYVRALLELPGRELLRAGCTGIYLKPFGMRLLAAVASLLVIRHFLSTCIAHILT